MTTPIPDLLDSDDLDLFNASDTDFFLAAAGDTIRNYCQWHIAPSVSTVDTVPVQPEGTIMLPSLYVTALDSITINGLTVDPSSYEWFTGGYVKRIQVQQFWQWPLWPLQSDAPFREYPSPLAVHAVVAYTHGYDQTPPAVKAVAFELAARAMEIPSGVATTVTAGPNTISFGALGVVLTEDQRRRLGPFSLGLSRF